MLQKVIRLLSQKKLLGLLKGQNSSHPVCLSHPHEDILLLAAQHCDSIPSLCHDNNMCTRAKDVLVVKQVGLMQQELMPLLYGLNYYFIMDCVSIFITCL